MTIKKILFVILSLFILVGSVSARKITSSRITISFKNEDDTAKVRINSSFLLLGTLNDYINRKYITNQNQFDKYYKYERPLMNYVDSIAKKDFNITLEEKWEFYISDELTKKMDSYYNKHQLIDSLFTNNEKKLSFISGVYLRYGEKINNDFYKIELTNSPKHATVYSLLKQLNCENILFKRIDNIPNIFVIYFQATDSIKKYFAVIEPEREKLIASKIKHFSFTNELRTYIAKKDLAIVEAFK